MEGKTVSKVDRRYELLDLLGRGGMGAVYLAKDLLTGKHVALKQVSAPAEDLIGGAIGEEGPGSDYNLTLAQEFQALATLRHPHIISVYDFGFDRSRKPYFTMEYIKDGREILAYGQDLPLERRVGLLVQMLQALVYLHRRGILHRDLKPGNALVVGGQVKLLDFGLSVITSRSVEHVTQSTVGTMAYLAPEIFRNQPYSKASDLYGVGVIAHQLLCGHFPYRTVSLAVLLHDILEKPADAAASGLDRGLALVVNRLLAKNREDRYDEAREVIHDLCLAAAIPQPPESVEIRESFLQAAKFVGREEEMELLSSGLQEALRGQGSAVLIGGESGVGKSRLMEELRIRALVEGVLVLRGQAVEIGRSPYELWREILHSLSLQVDLNPEQASLFKAALVDVDQTTAGDFPSLPRLTPQESQERLCRAVSDALARTQRPVLIILEDLQWAGSESLDLLSGLMSTISHRALLIVGAFRDDRPLPVLSDLAQAKTISLRRLDQESIADFSQAMLGDSGRDPAVVKLLWQETDGNAFFLVEVVRALAEEAGRLDRISAATLSENIMTGGIQAIMDRRLARVPEEARPLMLQASVAARVLDLDLLRLLEPDVDLDSWLSVVTEVTVLEPFGDTWRFAHDKLREAIRESLSHELHHELHHRVAAGMEALYPAEPDKAGALALHWGIAGNREKELHYAEIAAAQAASNNATIEATQYFERALRALRALPGSSQRDEHEQSLLSALRELHA